MKSRSYQFGLLSLLVLTTGAAGSFAVIRLPLPLVAKIVMVQSVVVCFIGWAVRNRKYPDPRLATKPASGTYSLWINAALHLAFVAVLSVSYFRLSSRPFAAADLIFCGLMLLSACSIVLLFVFAAWANTRRCNAGKSSSARR